MLQLGEGALVGAVALFQRGEAALNRQGEPQHRPGSQPAGQERQDTALFLRLAGHPGPGDLLGDGLRGRALRCLALRRGKRRLLDAEQRPDGDAVQPAELNQFGDVRQGGVTLPLGDGLAADAEPLPKGLLGEAQTLSPFGDELAGGLFGHGRCLLSVPSIPSPPGNVHQAVGGVLSTAGCPGPHIGPVGGRISQAHKIAGSVRQMPEGGGIPASNASRRPGIAVRCRTRTGGLHDHFHQRKYTKTPARERRAFR